MSGHESGDVPKVDVKVGGELELHVHLCCDGSLQLLQQDVHVLVPSDSLVFLGNWVAVISWRNATQVSAQPGEVLDVLTSEAMVDFSSCSSVEIRLVQFGHVEEPNVSKDG
jgi:hypothetical protein